LSSAGGRGIPDISAQALNFLFVKLSRPIRSSGTSFAAPVRSHILHTASGTQLITNAQTAASIISLLNDYLLSTDRPPLGFLNPLLYGNLRAAMNDITSGSNPGCKTPGFSAVPGWDPVRFASLTLRPFNCLLIVGSQGDGSWDARLFEPAGST
jgi:tripeptidyl-peptidase-1